VHEYEHGLFYLFSTVFISPVNDPTAADARDLFPAFGSPMDLLKGYLSTRKSLVAAMADFFTQGAPRSFVAHCAGTCVCTLPLHFVSRSTYCSS
jgi:hypothetical protein